MDTSLSVIKNDFIGFVNRVIDASDTIVLIDDTSELIGNVSTTYDMVRKFYLFYERKKFEAFIVELFKKLHTGSLNYTINQNELEDYFINSRNLEHMSQIIDSSLHSQSIYCSAILGYYAGGLLLEKKHLEYRDTIAVNALRTMNDKDLFNFIKLYQFVQARPDLFEKQKQSQLRTFDIREDLATLNIPLFELELTIEKLKNIQGIGYDVGGFSRIGNAWGTFIFNENSDYLYGLVEPFERLIKV